MMDNGAAPGMDAKSSRPWQNALGLVGWLFLTATVGYTALFLFAHYPTLFHSDSALKSAIADVALREGRLLPRGWTFANGDLLTLTPYAFVLPISALSGLNYGGNALASFLSYLAMLAGIAVFMARMAPGRRDVMMAALVLCGCSLGAANLEFLVAQGAYSLYAAFAFVLFALMLGDNGGRKGVAAIFLIAALIASSNDKRALAMVFLPLGLALPISALACGPGRLRQFWLSIANVRVAALATGALTGALLYRLWLLPSVDNYDAAAQVSLATPEHMWRVLRNLPSDWFEYFRILGHWKELGMGMGLLQAFSWSVAVAILLAPALLLFSRNAIHRRIGWLTYALIASGFAPLVVLQGLYWNAVEVRYCTLGILLGSIATALVVSKYEFRWPRTTRLALLALMIGGAIVSMAWLRLSTPANPDARGISLVDRRALIDRLVELRVGTGLATYWNSHVLSVLSSGRVIVHPVGYNDRLGPFPHHVPHAPADGSGGPHQAVILTQSEFSTDHGAAVVRQLGEPTQRLEVGPYVVWVYDKNIADLVYGEGFRFDDAADSSRIGIDTGAGLISQCTHAAPCSIHLHLRNTGQDTLASAGRYPMRIGLRGLDAQGNPIADIGRLEFPTPLAPGDEVSVQTKVPPLPDNVVAVRPCLLQEMVNWHCERTTPIQNNPHEVNEAIAREQLGVKLSTQEVQACRNPPCSVDVQVRNTGSQTLVSKGRFPLRLGVQAYNAAGQLVDRDAGRLDFQTALKTGETANLTFELPHTPHASAYRLCLLQEMVSWHCEVTSTDATAAKER